MLIVVKLSEWQILQNGGAARRVVPDVQIIHPIGVGTDIVQHLVGGIEADDNGGQGHTMRLSILSRARIMNESLVDCVACRYE